MILYFYSIITKIDTGIYALDFSLDCGRNIARDIMSAPAIQVRPEPEPEQSPMLAVASVATLNPLLISRLFQCYPLDRWDMSSAKQGGLAQTTKHKIMYLCIKIY
jgi:alpha-beta hydrolase superfamily lysophospholipase